MYDEEHALSKEGLIFCAGEKIVPLYMMLLDPKEAGEKSGEFRNLVYSHAYHQFLVKLVNNYQSLNMGDVEIGGDDISNPLSDAVYIPPPKMAPGVRKEAAKDVAEAYHLSY
ncbi:MAG: hypothetical protein HA496_10760 [Thaumarchaeota archaeon]|nr:hypothetical protein [Nitrososphaerota archaeon]